ncbi:beta-1,4-mannooligosaccharide/beta-1,4-mannosyl-N-acetylglucosamine phosphorylase [Caldicellulosiruptor bescii]|uniref:Glycosidase PH1107-related n=2 Tax=Caldicellulosiruptor bescii TaxID=31899 RepID=B9MP64_CALBD|nr:glycoside hydrolase family 130 protein [Caldicellulosiruptor bescii]ACM61623.1 glycosidase PH1107-related [Caldicellulosiruptor bescii DSM 6725]PBC88568.1 beta-1,4-mannooligosaccharide/beta-1,4-mannosyl-N-acetylglucosamine phosphorylase [Caldicellulosiruptor bescii]PBC91951.1 beta-1,4-mannooligosaccharide/beta-1,4-mannosyl-N-acetylglucosamine phosphorylase [Caldicellulosiruptor bescii]PBD02638.1 beta-1,4-mannooligosaccharide/beta-1,4-mannosyl-N-acetylglucosamine phosphorylase [Caldicellulosi
MDIKIIGQSLPNMPWEERPKDCKDIVWRSKHNPIIKRNQAKDANSIFNSAVVPFKDGFAGVFRVDDRARRMNIRRGFSKDGYNWEIDDEPINFIQQTRDPLVSEYKYDPRVTFIEDRYYITWCNGYHGPTIGVGYTFDFEKFYQIENAFLPYNRNGVLFPRKINGKYAMLSRPSDTGHTPFGDIFYSESPDMIHWGCHRHVMSAGYTPWQSLKIGAGPTPIETSEGWLLIYHGVLLSCNGYVYSFGAALLDLEKPWIVKARSKSYLLSPQEYYECVGDVPNVVFPCATLCDASTGRLAIYYGGADTVVNLAFAYVQDIIELLKRESQE